MINIEHDSSGRVYEIWKQNQMNSCGVASVWMARGIARQMSIAEDEWTLAQKVYRSAVGNALAPLGVASSSGPMTLDPRAFRVDQELACDAAVIRGRPDARTLYGETLLKTQLAATPLPFGCYWPARGLHPLEVRIGLLKRRKGVAVRSDGMAVVSATVESIRP